LVPSSTYLNWPHPAFLFWVLWVPSLGVKQSVYESDHWPLVVVGLRMSGTTPPLPQIPVLYLRNFY